MAEFSFEDFKKIIERLRDKDGCPWDREQTHESLRQAMLEECYEALDAIDKGDLENLKEELGDILLQVVMHSVIAEEAGEFTMNGVIEGISEKMIRRHPHVFGNRSVSGSSEVLSNWEEIKKLEKSETKASEGILRVPDALPANVRAEKVLKKAAKAGIGFEDAKQASEEVHAMLKRVENAAFEGNSGVSEEDFGRLMLSVINLSGFLRINAENSLTKATNKFINRFVSVEDLVAETGRKIDDMPAPELKAMWGQVSESGLEPVIE